MVNVARLEPVDLREVWPREAADFTPWLADNLQTLGEVLGFDLQLQQREAAVGAFSLDLLASEVNTNRVVIIENQLEQTNHDHLGKLLTYAAGHEADVVVWIAKELREEHRQALDWLNQRTDSRTDFYGVVVGAVRIDNSRPAYRFDVKAQPNQTGKTERLRVQANPVVSERREAYRAFFQALMDELRERYRFTNARTGQPQSWYNFTSGFRGVTYGANFTGDGRARAELYLDLGVVDCTKNLFDELLRRRPEFDAVLGDVQWERLDNRRACRIALSKPGRIDDTPEVLAATKEWMIQSLLKLKAVFTPALAPAFRTLGTVEAPIEEEEQGDEADQDKGTA